MQAGVPDGDARLAREDVQQLPVGGGEHALALPGQQQRAEPGAVHEHRHAEGARRVRARPAAVQQRAGEAFRVGGAVGAVGDEPADGVAVLAEHGQCGVAGPGQLGGGRHDAFQQGVGLDLAADGLHGLEQPRHLLHEPRVISPDARRKSGSGSASRARRDGGATRAAHAVRAVRAVRAVHSGRSRGRAGGGTGPPARRVRRAARAAPRGPGPGPAPRRPPPDRSAGA